MIAINKHPMTSEHTLSFVTLDVFTSTRFAGNPLAVVRVPSSITLSQQQKQLIAREFNLSETVILHEKTTTDNIWTIDIFLTNGEVPFAGHPTIGSACYVLSQQEGEEIKGAFITKAGRIELHYSAAEKVARADIPHNFHLHKATLTKERLLELQPSLSKKASLLPAHSPIVSIVKGMSFVLIQLDSVETLADVSTGAFKTDVELDDDWKPSFSGLYFYVLLEQSADGTRQLRTRMLEGILEDPATGSAASALVSYLSTERGSPGVLSYKYAITQGIEMGRKSEIGVNVTLKAEKQIEKVQLIGGAVKVMEGQITV